MFIQSPITDAIRTWADKHQITTSIAAWNDLYAAIQQIKNKARQSGENSERSFPRSQDMTGR